MPLKKSKAPNLVLCEQELCTLIKMNYKRFPNNRQLAAFLGIKLSTLRRLCYKVGLKRMEMEYFNKKLEKYLIRHYHAKGDIELAEIFQKKWPKKKGWTKKHIEKKRKYLKLKRTAQEIKTIHNRNVNAGRFAMCPAKAWDRRGRAKEGEIRYWRNHQTGRTFPVIKHNGRFIHWGRWAWNNGFGNVKKGMNVIFKDGNPFNLSLKNLSLVSDKDLARINAQKSSKSLSDNYVAGLLTHKDPELRKIIKQYPYLLELKRKQLTLNRAIYERKTS